MKKRALIFCTIISATFIAAMEQEIIELDGKSITLFEDKNDKIIQDDRDMKAMHDYRQITYANYNEYNHLVTALTDIDGEISSLKISFLELIKKRNLLITKRQDMEIAFVDMELKRKTGGTCVCLIL